MLDFGNILSAFMVCLEDCGNRWGRCTDSGLWIESNMMLTLIKQTTKQILS